MTKAKAAKALSDAVSRFTAAFDAIPDDPKAPDHDAKFDRAVSLSFEIEKANKVYLSARG